VVCWGKKSKKINQNKNKKTTTQNQENIKQNSPKKQGDNSSIVSELKHVESICGTRGAFAALKKDGTVATWGDKGQKMRRTYRITNLFEPQRRRKNEEKRQRKGKKERK